MEHNKLFLTTQGVVSDIGVKSKENIPLGTFLGFYAGRIIPLKNISDDQSHITMEVDGTKYAIVRESKDDIMGYINEPNKGSTANVYMRTLHLACGNGVAYFAARDIPKNTELLEIYTTENTR